MNIPKEISDFLKIKGNHLLLVKGEPGVGKTIFSLEVLRELKKTKGIYFSTRDMIESVSTQIPWIKEIIPENLFVDVLSSTAPFTKQDISVTNTIELTTLPKFLKELYLTILSVEREAPDQEVFIIIDSLDALATALNVSRDNFISWIKKILVSLNVKAIVTSETSQISDIDFIADGVVLLKKMFYKKRILREIQFEKLRGMEIFRPFLIFTLDSGHFYCFQEKMQFKKENIVGYKAFLKTLAKKKVDIKSVVDLTRTFERFMGPVEYCSCILFSFSSKFPGFLQGIITSIFVIRFLLQGNHVIYMPKKSVNTDLITYIFSLLVGKDKIRNLHVISFFDKPINFEFEPSDNINIQDVYDSFIKVIDSYAKNQPMLVILDLNHLLAYFEDYKEILKLTTGILTRLRKYNSFCIIKTFYHKMTHQMLEEVADCSFHLFSISDAHFLFGSKPYTPIYNIHLRMIGTIPKIDLKIIV